MSGWKPTTDNLLTRMKMSTDIFGEELNSVNKVQEEETLINYFEEKLSKLLEWDIFINTIYADSTFDGQGEPITIKLRPEGFGLSIKQCHEILDYIKMSIVYTRTGKPYLHWTDSVIVLNYIKNGYKLRESGYEFNESKYGISLHKYDAKLM